MRAGLPTNPARVMAITMIRDVLRTTGITATVGIGTNLYLAKVAMDIVAKKSPADQDGVRIAELNEDSYKFLLWDHKPLTDFWQIGNGKARRLEKAYMFTMGDIAARTQWDEEYFYKTFGIDGEILIDHAWGIEPVTMADIKSYKSDGHSLSNGQVLPRPYQYQEARLVFHEMIEVLCSDMFSKNLVTQGCSWWVSYDYKSLEACPSYDGPLSIDFYGRLHPKHSNGTVKLPTVTNNLQIVSAPLLKSFDDKTDHRLLYRRLGVCANDVKEVPYTEKTDVWDKARVARIIDNAKYTGSDVYDPIIDEDIFEEAAAAKAARQRNQIINECEGIALMRDRIRCGVCGAPMVRHICSKRKVKESWTCANDVCGCRVRISDSDLLMKVTLLMNRIIENADLLVPKPKKRFKDSLTVQRLQGEIDDELAHDQPSEKLIVTRIREIASQLYQETNAKDQIAARIAQKRVALMSPQIEFNTAYFTDLVENVVLEAPARVTLITKTDVNISEGEPDYGSQENTQEDGDAD